MAAVPPALLAALPDHETALRSGDVPRATAALLALLAPAADGDVSRWLDYVAEFPTGLCVAIRDLVQSAVGSVVVQTLLVPVLEGLTHSVQAQVLANLGLLQSMMQALVDQASAATPDVAVQTRAVCLLSAAFELLEVDTSYLVDRDVRLDCTRALVALVRLCKSRAEVRLAAAAANLLRLMCVVTEDRDRNSWFAAEDRDSEIWEAARTAGVLSAAVAALPFAACVSPAALGGFRERRRSPAEQIMLFLAAAHADFELVRYLLGTQPGCIHPLLQFVCFLRRRCMLGAKDRDLVCKFVRRLCEEPCFCLAALSDEQLPLQVLTDQTWNDLRCFRDACNEDNALLLLRFPLPGRELTAAASLAVLNANNTNALDIEAVLLEGVRLELLLSHCVREVIAHEAAQRGTDQDTADAAASLRAVRCRGLAHAVHCVALEARLLYHDEERELTVRPAKRARAGPVGVLTRADVNVPRYDTLTLLAAGQQLHVSGLLMEAASPLLKDLLSGADAPADGRRGERLVLPVPADVEPEAFHALCCAAVEHTYTGDVQDLPSASLLPLWCVGRHLQMAALQAWCTARVADAAKEQASDAMDLVVDALGVALRHKCELLLRAAACGVLSLQLLLEQPVLLARALQPHEGAADALADACAAVLREALGQKRDAAAAAAAAAEAAAAAW